MNNIFNPSFLVMNMNSTADTKRNDSSLAFDFGALMARRDALGDFASAVDAACKAKGLDMGLDQLLFCLRDMPYQRPSSSSDVNAIITEWRGTCSGKHIAVHALLHEIGLKPTLMMRAYRVDEADTLPRALLDKFSGKGIWDVHNFVLCNLNGRQTAIDITWPLSLREAGFTTTAHWNGTQDFLIAAPAGKDQEISPTELGLTQKKELLSAVNNPDSMAIREAFIEALADYADKLAPPATMRETIDATIAVYAKQRGE